MKKMKKPKQRNPFVVHVAKRKQGAHDSSRKAARSRLKAELRQALA